MGNSISMFRVIKQILRIKRTPSQGDMYCLREILRILFVKQSVSGKEERLFLDRVFANLQSLGDDTRLRSCLINHLSDEVDALAERYMGKPVNSDSGLAFTLRDYEDLRVGKCAAIYLLSRCILHNNPTSLDKLPDWYNDTQLTTAFVDNTHASSHRGHKELKNLSIMIYKMPFAVDIDEDEKKFLYFLLSRLYLLDNPRALRREVVKKVDFNALSKRYAKSHSDHPYCFHENDIILGKLGQSEALLRLGWGILSHNHRRIFAQP